MKGISTSKASTSLMQRASTKQEDLPTLIVLVGPTGVGKTALSIRLAQYFGCSILSADSRQIFREIPIGTAAPSDEERAAVPHYFVGTRSVTEPYSAATFESEVLELLPQVFAESSSSTALLSGGSMMYVDAVTKGIDSMPDVPEEVRSAVWERYAAEGLTESLRSCVSWIQSIIRRLIRRTTSVCSMAMRCVLLQGAPSPLSIRGSRKLVPSVLSRSAHPRS